MGLNNLKEYYRQAEIALEFGEKYTPTKWVHQFSEYIFTYILEKVTEEFSAEFLNSPILERLHRYDCENNTELIKTLKVYLKNRMNAVQTAKDLFIHRATMVYRLERIKEIGKTDLKKEDEILHLYLSIRLFDFAKNNL